MPLCGKFTRALTFQNVRCRCQDTACLRGPASIKEQRQLGALAFGGNLLGTFDEKGIAQARILKIPLYMPLCGKFTRALTFQNVM